MKVNKIEYEDILSYYEFINKYKDNLKESIEKGDISQELIDNLAATMLDHQHDIDIKYKYAIKEIYIAIIETKYIEYPNGYMDSIYKLVKYITYLNNDWDFNNMCKLNPNKKSELCNEVYEFLLTDGIDEPYLSKEMDEEFKPEHLLDLDYQLNNLKKYSTNEKFLKELDKKEWRLI